MWVLERVNYKPVVLSLSKYGLPDKRTSTGSALRFSYKGHP